MAVKVWDGASWVDAQTVNVWDGTQWACKDTSVWDGVAWNPCFTCEPWEDVFTPPGPPTGIAYDGTYLWISVASQAKLYRLTESGDVVDQYSSPGTNPWGLTYGDREYLWHVDRDTQTAYKIDIHTGNTVSSFSTTSFASDPVGIAYDGWHLHIVDGTAAEVHRVETNGVWIESTSLSSTTPKGICWAPGMYYSRHPYDLIIQGYRARSPGVFLYGDGGTIYRLTDRWETVDYIPYPSNEKRPHIAVGNNAIWAYGSGGLRKYDMSGNLLSVMGNVPSGKYCNGLAWDGTYLWAKLGGDTYKLNTDGSVAVGPIDDSYRSNDLTYDGTNLWGARSTRLYKIDSAGQKIGESRVSGFSLNAVAWNGQRFICVGERGSDYHVLIVDTSGNVLYDYAGFQDATAISVDGSFVWFVSRWGNVSNHRQEKEPIIQKMTRYYMTNLSTTVAPSLDTVDIAWYGNNLWIADHGGGIIGKSKVYRLSLFDGLRTSDVVYQFSAIPLSDNKIVRSIWTGHSFITRVGRAVHKMDIFGNLYQEMFSLSSSSDPIAYDGTNFYTRGDRDVIDVLDSNGTKVDSIPFEGEDIFSLDWYNGYLYVASKYDIYRVDVASKEVSKLFKANEARGYLDNITVMNNTVYIGAGHGTWYIYDMQGNLLTRNTDEDAINTYGEVSNDGRFLIATRYVGNKPNIAYHVI